MKIEDKEITGTVVSTGDGTYYLRLAAPSMMEQIGLPSSWYEYEDEGFSSVPAKYSLEAEADLERAYQELVKEVSQ